MNVEVRSITFSYGGEDVLKNVSFSVGSGELVAVLGPNGAGKSTFFGCLLGFLKPSSGEVLIDGKNVLSLSGRETARYIAYIPQYAPQTFNYTALDMVTMGMTGQMGLFSSPKPEQRERAMAALDSLGIAALGLEGYTVLFSTHEPNQAFRFSTRVLALKGGRVAADGAPGEALTGELLSGLYGVGVAVTDVDVGKERFKISLAFNAEE